MALAGVLTAVANQVRTAGFTQWRDAFPVDNIPSTILDRAFHIEVGSVTSSAANQRAHVFRMPINIRVLRRGFKEAGSQVESCMLDADTILAALLAPSFRLQVVDSYGVKDLVPLGIDLDPISSSNDNDFILSLRFEALIISTF